MNTTTMTMNNQELWNKCIEFHGHSCGGLAIGFRAALYAKRLLDLDFSDDEQTVCVAENDSCSVDAVQVVLGCSVGKGNLLFHMTGKQAFSFYNRVTGKSVRLITRLKPQGMTKEQSFAYYRETPDEQLFEIKETRIPMPEEARLFESYICESCGELTASNWIRIREGKKLCIDCYQSYDRFHV